MFSFRFAQNPGVARSSAFRQMAGVTLVEMLVYMTILSIVSVGIFTLLLEIQKTNVNTANMADQLAEADISLRRVQVKLGDSDDVTSEDLVDKVNNVTYPNACLRLKRYEPYKRTGFHFDGRNQYLRSSSLNADWFPIQRYAPRSISVWFQADKEQTGRQTIVSWGAEDVSNARFGFDLVDGHLVVSLRCADVKIVNSTDLRDGNWHHVIVTHNAPADGTITSSNMSIHLDGEYRQTQYADVCATGNRQGLLTHRSPLFIGRNPERADTAFRGLISDLRIWQRAISPEEAYALHRRQPDAGSNTANLELHLPLDQLPPAGLTNRGQWPAGSSFALFNYDNLSDAVVPTIVDDTLTHSFCFIDDDGDGLHEIWESATARALPDRVGGDSMQVRGQEWDLRSEDIFVPGAAGFFSVVGNDPETVIANFAVGKGLPNKDDISQKAESKALASTRVKKRLELCSINPQPSVDGVLCSFRNAYIAVEDYDPHHGGRIDFQYVGQNDSGDFIRFSNFPNVPSSITGTWYKKHGVLRLDNPEPLETKVWARIMSQALYRPVGQSAPATKSFTFSLGQLPFFENGTFRYFDFVDSQPDENSFDNAMVRASNTDEAACGMRSYMATIQSRREQDHLVRAMETGPIGAVRSGWIGAKVNAAAEISWVSDPSAERNFTFWQGDGVDGQAYNAQTNSPVLVSARKLFDFDQLPYISGHRKQTLSQHGDVTKRLHFTNWSGGNDVVNCSSVNGSHPHQRRQLCQPVELSNGSGVAINGHLQRHGTWVTSPDTNRRCDENQNHSICGFYREFDHDDEASARGLAELVTVSMDRFREFCLGN